MGSTPKFEGWYGEVLQSAVSVEVGCGDSCNSKLIRVIDVLETTEIHLCCHTGTRVSPTKMAVNSIAQLDDIYTTMDGAWAKSRSLNHSRKIMCRHVVDSPSLEVFSRCVCGA